MATNTPLITIPGISYVLASIILSEIGNIKNFSNSGKLLAFAELEPSAHQSGNYTATIARIWSKEAPNTCVDLYYKQLEQ